MDGSVSEGLLSDIDEGQTEKTRDVRSAEVSRPLREERAMSFLSSIGYARCFMMLLLSNCQIELNRGEVRSGEQVVNLTDLEVKLLRYLVANADRAVSRDELHREVWGYATGVQSRAADFSMSRLRRKIERVPKQPVHLLSVRGEGYRFQAAAGDALPIPPVPETSFHGREAELIALSDALDQARLVSLLGPGGVGKTRMALRFVELQRQNARWSGGLLFCEISAARTAEEATEAVARALGLPPSRLERSVQVGQALTARGRLLLVLDNLEQVPAAPLVLSWLACAPELHCLVTSRDRLNVAAVHTVPIGPLSPQLAEALFAVRPGLTSSAAVRELVAVLEGLPLALELAAARCCLFSPEQLTKRIAGSSLSLLTSTHLDRPLRHRTLFAAVEWSWKLLLPWERDAVAQCALLPDGFTLAAAEVGVDLSAHPDAPAVIDAVAMLCDRSMCWLDTSGDEPRLRLYKAVRDFSLEHVASIDTIAAARGRWLDWAVTEAESKAQSLAEATSKNAAGYLISEQANLLAAWQEAPVGSATASRLAVALAPIVGLQGPWHVLEALMERGVADAKACGDHELQHRAQLVQGHGCRMLGHYQRCNSVLQALLADDPSVEVAVIARVEWAASLRRVGATTQATVLCHQVLELTQTEMPVQRGRAQTILGLIVADHAQPQRALALHREALATFLAAGAVQYEATARSNLAGRLRDLGRYEESREQYRLADLTAEHTGSQRVKALLLQGQMRLELAAGDLEAAEDLGTREAELARALGDRATVAWSLGNLAALSLERGMLELAERRLDEAEALHRAVGSPMGVIAMLANRGILAHIRGQPHDAIPFFERAVESAHQGGATTMEVLARGYQSMAHAAAGQKSEAREALDLAVSADCANAWNDFLAVAQGVWLAACGDLMGARACLVLGGDHPVQDTRMALQMLDRATSGP
jgi:predicted ATPase/DNA-binding winged helix-turn-helix (wHTH) protein